MIDNPIPIVVRTVDSQGHLSDQGVHRLYLEPNMVSFVPLRAPADIREIRIEMPPFLPTPAKAKLHGEAVLESENST